MAPQVSVVVPVYNVEGYLRRAVESIRGHVDHEIVLVDDASTDGSLALANELAASRDDIRVVALEQTANLAGGTVWPLAQAEAVAEAARSAGLMVHMDGARLLNATTALGCEPAAFGRLCDSVWIDLSKGLGCPVGAVLAGSAAFIEEVWRWKQRIGGAMRQAGILAAAGIYALDHHLERLADDQANALAFAEAVARLPQAKIDMESVQSNIVYFDVPGRDAAVISASLSATGVEIGAMGSETLRAVTHLDVSHDQVLEAAQVLASELAQMSG